jgi:hypothetical protein
MFIAIIQKETIPFLILKIMAISTLIIACYGIYQYISGFESTREYVAEILSQKNILLPQEAKVRLNSNFIFSTFSISNSFAAHLILTAPICLYMLLHSDLLKTKIFRYTFTSAAMLILIAALLLSGSRGAILSFALAAVILSVLLSMKSKKSVLLIIAALLGASAVIFLVPKDSGKKQPDYRCRLGRVFSLLYIFKKVHDNRSAA